MNKQKAEKGPIGKETISSGTKIKIVKLDFAKKILKVLKDSLAIFYAQITRKYVRYTGRQAPKLNKYILALLKRITLNMKTRNGELL